MRIHDSLDSFRMDFCRKAARCVFNHDTKQTQRKTIKSATLTTTIDFPLQK